MDFAHIIEGIWQENLDSRALQHCASAIFDGDWNDIQIAAFLTALQSRPYSGSQLAIFAQELRNRCIPVTPKSTELVDTCGTGGGLATFNISTGAAFVVAGAGISVAKHGNRAVTSQCGSADVLEALGAKLSAEPAELARLTDEVGIAFLFAPNHHPAMKAVGAVRRELKFRTIFNLLGPLANPAKVARQVVGVYSEQYLLPIAEALVDLGAERAIVVHGEGLDELAPFGVSLAQVIENSSVTKTEFTPSSWGIEPVELSQIQGKFEASESAICIQEAFSDVNSVWARALLPSAAAAIWVSGQVENFAEAGSRAQESIQSGNAMAKLEQFIEESNRF